jgi:hypothetical protein
MLFETDARNYQTDTAYTNDAGVKIVTTTFPLTPPDGERRTRVEKSACCGVFEEKDENDHRTYYDYIGGRVARMRTDIQSPGQWLVTYDFDEFGRRRKAMTLSRKESVYVINRMVSG